MYLVRHVIGTASELGLKQLSFIITQQNPWNAKQNPPKIPVGPKLEIEQPSATD